jgi:hypothetical protein
MTINKGRAGLPTRLMAGLHLLKHMKGLSDEQVCAVWLENPYFQAFCGADYFQHERPFDRASMTRWRQRIGAICVWRQNRNRHRQFESERWAVCGGCAVPAGKSL